MYTCLIFMKALDEHNHATFGASSKNEVKNESMKHFYYTVLHDLIDDSKHIIEEGQSVKIAWNGNYTDLCEGQRLTAKQDKQLNKKH